MEVRLGVERHGGAGHVAIAENPLAAAVHHGAAGEHHHGCLVRRGLGAQLLDRVDRRTEPRLVECGSDDVLVSPDDTLRRSGGPAGVEDIRVVSGAAGQADRRRTRDRVLVIVTQDDEVLEVRELELAHDVDVLGRHDRDDAVRVVVNVGQFVAQVLVVDVDRRQASLEARVERLHPLDAVGRVHRHVRTGLDAQ